MPYSAMMAKELLEAFGSEIEDANQETFELFSHSNSSQDLGMVDAKATDLSISIAGRDYTIKQSPGILQSNRQGGTTGAVLWRVSVQIAEWLASSQNALFEQGNIDSKSVVLELGSGISGLIPSVLGSRVNRVIATDQQYALKLLQENLDANRLSSSSKIGNQKARIDGSKRCNIDLHALDWETDDMASFLQVQGLVSGVDAIIVCDCVFNYALIDPLVSTCRDICRARENYRNSIALETIRPTICVIAQQLRQPDVFEQWLEAFLKEFIVWRIPEEKLLGNSKEWTGFVVHIGILR